MENCDVPTREHNNRRRRRLSACLAESTWKPGAYGKCPCCSDDQVSKLNPKPQHSATSANLSQKRKWTSVARPPEPSVEHPEAPTPQPSTSAVDIPGLLNLVPRPQSAIPPAELPVVSDVAPCPRPSTAPLQHDGPLKIHNRSVEEYQKIYHEVVDDMLRYKGGRLRPYNLTLGRRIKQKLWERLDRPMITTSSDEDGLVHVDVSHAVGDCPPLYAVDTVGEPAPPKNRAKN